MMNRDGNPSAFWPAIVDGKWMIADETGVLAGPFADYGKALEFAELAAMAVQSLSTAAIIQLALRNTPAFAQLLLRASDVEPTD